MISEKKIDYLCIVLVLVAFAIDVYLPDWISGGFPYVIVIFLSLWASKNRYVTLFAILSTLLATTSMYLSSYNAGFVISFSENVLVFFAIWTVAFLGIRRKTIEQRLINSNAELQSKAKEIEKQTQKLNEANQALKELALTDPLTGVLNRRGLEKSYQHIAKDAERSGEASHIFLIDIDNFKNINETFGYVVGDTAIKKVSEVINQTIRSTDYVGRVGGDEFMIILRRAREAETLSVAEKIRLAISRVQIGVSQGETVNLTASLGAVGIVNEKASLEELMEKSYFQMNRSKELGKNKVTFQTQSGSRRDHSLDLFSHLLGIDEESKNEFYTVKQNILKLSDQSSVGVEVFARLSHNNFNLPDDFFRLAIETKVLKIVDRMCLETNLKSSAALPKGIQVHINIYPSTLVEMPIAQWLDEFTPYQQDRTYCIEISEQQIIGDPYGLSKVVKALRAKGVLIALDDAGFGNSCLESLVTLEPDIVKIDRSCVDGLSKNAGSVRRLKRLLNIIRSCDAQAYAEGIETKEDLDILIDQGVEYGQGFLFDKPSLLSAEVKK